MARQWGGRGVLQSFALGLCAVSCAKAKMTVQVAHSSLHRSAEAGSIQPTLQPVDTAKIDQVLVPPVAPAAGNTPVSSRSALPQSLRDLDLFIDGRPKQPKSGTILYQVAAPLWSDQMGKQRYVHIPAGTTITYDGKAARFNFPIGTTFIKHFTRANGEDVETRVLALQANGEWLMGTYQWLSQQSSLLSAGATVEGSEPGVASYRIPSTEDCRTCHNASQGPILGFRPDQLHSAGAAGSQQLLSLIKASVIANTGQDALLSVAENVDPAELSLPLGLRLSSYLNINCSTCHNPAGTASFLDLTSAVKDKDVLLAQGYLSPGSPTTSLLWQRFTAAEFRMPPQSTRPDPLGLALLDAWIRSLPPASLAPIEPSSAAAASASAPPASERSQPPPPPP